MRLGLALAGVTTMTLVLGGSAQAQTPSLAGVSEYKGYLEATAHASFGNQTSQSYGAELGLRIQNDLHIFIDFGQVRSDSPLILGPSALSIAASLTQIQNGSVTFTAKTPIDLGVAGVKYLIPLDGPFEPYVLGGFGVARVTKDVHFFVAGTDVTSNLTQFGVVLGRDLTGSVNSPTMTLGAGVVWPVWQRIVVDFQYRFSRVFNGGDSLSISRAGLGLGVRF